MFSHQPFRASLVSSVLSCFLHYFNMYFFSFVVPDSQHSFDGVPKSGLGTPDDSFCYLGLEEATGYLGCGCQTGSSETRSTNLRTLERTLQHLLIFTFMLQFCNL